MPFTFMESLRTGIDRLDDDHQQLVSHINSIAEVEQGGGAAALTHALSEFKTDLVRHFQEEESHLRAANYPKVDSHAKHHAEIIVALDRLIWDVRNGEPMEESVAHACHHELVSVVLLRDMQFINWLADHSGTDNA